MRVYADSSFLVKLVSAEAEAEAARTAYWRLGLPKLFFLPLHALEVENAVRLRAFHLRRTLASRERGRLVQEVSASLARLQHRLSRGLLQEIEPDWEDAVHLARKLSEKYSEKLGTRSLDLLHVAFALQLETEKFLTTDRQQSDLARATGLQVIATADA